MLQFGAPAELKNVQNLPIPALNKDEALLRVKAFGVNPSETYVRAGQYAQLPQLPYTPGKDCAGEVVRLCNDAKTVEISNKTVSLGDRVYTTETVTGAYATHAVVKLKDLRKLPAHASFNAGASLGVPGTTAYRALIEKGQAKKGQSLFVHGAGGGVGNLIVQAAKQMGMSPIVGTASSAEGIRALESLNCLDMILDHSEENYMDKLTQFFEMKSKTLKKRPVNGKPSFDLIIEMQAQHNMQKDIDHLAFGGTIVVVGNKGVTETSVNARAIMQCEGRITGFVGNPPGNDGEQHVRVSAEVERWLGDLLERQAIKPLVGQELNGLAGAAEAHELLGGVRKGASGRLVVVVSDDEAKCDEL